jgi:hypothetical protein
MVGNHRTYQNPIPSYPTFVPGKCNSVCPETMKINELAILLNNTATSGADKALAARGALPGRIIKAEAYRLYGRGNVDRWLKEKLFTVSQKHIDRQTLARVAAASNRISYLSAQERKHR